MNHIITSEDFTFVNIMATIPLTMVSYFVSRQLQRFLERATDRFFNRYQESDRNEAPASSHRLPT
ncbi:hypothetical protein BJX61DRAFT_501273 [Aspergillus egyptiacus]|nr:hypothetical protein BJX61DRAFT_501273 [Aspergillus egyptiacus]